MTPYSLLTNTYYTFVFFFPDYTHLVPLFSLSENSLHFPFTSSSCVFLLQKPMDKRRRKQAKTVKYDPEEVSSIEWEFINMTEQEEDLIYRMYRLVGDKWHLIAGRLPGRKAEEIERFWIMRHGEGFSGRRKGRES
ncbi:transcription factor TRY-like [Macadamia integrifolia]|uniref:transcription factor TRY-like n=1 Tax=Macadamia integrifolia TaxID=60698 RepID=UPI001C4F61D5|nr:transcription factor TRY-like [Macadamia integrifolia]